jgi:transcriptional regulator with XRE-family HTH domain
MLQRPKKSPDPIDLHVGQRLRQARITGDVSQEKLGIRLGLTFQQVQKYEKGTNRIAPSRLVVAAEFLHRDVAWFFEGAPNGARSNGHSLPDPMTKLGSSREGVRLATAFPRIRSPRFRASIVDLVESAAAGNTIVPELGR